MEPDLLSKRMQETVENLRKEFSGTVSAQTVIDSTQAVIQRYRTARIDDFVPVLVYRDAREYLGQLASHLPASEG